MKQLSLFGWLLLALATLSPRSSQAQGVGVGTTQPSPNAALDVSSPNKGLLLPRLPAAAAVAQPSAGLLIYSKQLQAPAYHDGTRWKTLAGAARSVSAAGQPDSVTYTVTSANTSFVNGVFTTVTNITTGISLPYTPGGISTGNANFQDVVLTKFMDANSTAFAKATTLGISSNMVSSFTCSCAARPRPPIR